MRLTVRRFVFALFLMLNAAPARAQDAIIFGDNNASCSQISGTGFKYTCAVAGLTVLDFKNNIVIFCYQMSGGEIAFWEKRGGWLVPTKVGGIRACIRRSYTAPKSVRGPIRFLQPAWRGGNMATSVASVAWSYDPNTQELGYCLTPEGFGNAILPFCDSAKVQDTE
jgi:hypothetical protein